MSEMSSIHRQTVRSVQATVRAMIGSPHANYVATSVVIGFVAGIVLLEFISPKPSLDWTAMGVIVALAVGIGSIWFQALESRRARKSRGLEIAAKEFDRWQSAEMLAIRKNVAAMLLATEGKGPLTDDLADLLNFFDSLGFMVRERIIEPQYVWSYFSTWFLPYCTASELCCTESRETDPNVWGDLEFLNKKIKDIEIERHPGHNLEHVLGSDAIRHRLEVEA